MVRFAQVEYCGSDECPWYKEDEMGDYFFDSCKKTGRKIGGDNFDAGLGYYTFPDWCPLPGPENI